MEYVQLSVPHSAVLDTVSSRSSGLTAIERRAGLAPRVLALWHLTSLDAPTVAVVWSLGFAWVAGVGLPEWLPWLLALGVWAVYVMDRVLDARAVLGGAVDTLANSPPNTLKDRHYFHWRHRRVLVPMACVAASVAACMVLRLMPVVARERDSVLAAAALAYFTRVHAGGERSRFLSRVISKEFLVGVIFACGCAMPAWVRAPFLSILCPVAFFAVLAWLNCHAIDRWESSEAAPGRWPVAGLGVAIGGIGLVLGAVLAPTQPRAASLLASGAVSALLLALLDRLRGRQRYRVDRLTLRAAADLVLLMPAALASFTWLAR